MGADVNDTVDDGRCGKGFLLHVVGGEDFGLRPCRDDGDLAVAGGDVESVVGEYG